MNGTLTKYLFSTSDGKLSYNSTKMLEHIVRLESIYESVQQSGQPGRVAQSVTRLSTDASLTADPGVASSIPAQPHTFVEIDHEIISMVILLHSAE